MRCTEPPYTLRNPVWTRSLAGFMAAWMVAFSVAACGDETGDLESNEISTAQQALTLLPDSDVREECAEISEAMVLPWLLIIAVARIVVTVAARVGPAIAPVIRTAGQGIITAAQAARNGGSTLTAVREIGKHIDKLKEVLPRIGNQSVRAELNELINLLDELLCGPLTAADVVY